MPEGAANPATIGPRHVATQSEPARLWDGHLSAECSIRHNGAPACPVCLTEQLRGAEG